MIGPHAQRPLLKKDNLWFMLALSFFLIYACLFIYRTSFVIDGERYFSLFDDAMISMRYAKNFADGYGLVWNPGGERVEGYTNPLWVLYMSVIHLLPVPQSKTSLLVQLTGALFLAANLYFVRNIALAISDDSQAVALGAVVLTASYLPINNWSLQGMEVSVLLVIMSYSLWKTIACLNKDSFSFSPYVLLGASTWVRPDMVVPLISLTVFLAVADPPRRLRHLAWGSLMLVAFTAAQTGLRLWYFGDIFPNTYYLKLTGYPFALRITAGLYALAQFVWNLNVALFALPFLLVLRRDRRILLLLWILFGQMAYSVYVGGDAWEYWGGSNRYISIAMPGFFVLLSCALFSAAGFLMSHVPTSRQPALAAPLNWRGKIFVLLLGFAVLSANSIYGLEAWAEALLIKPPLHTGNGDENHQEVVQSLLLSQMTTAEARIVVGRAGTIPYFINRYCIDLLGKTDRRIAHEDARRFEAGWHKFIEFRAGHMKFDYDYSIGELQPDVVAQLESHYLEAQSHLRKSYTGVRVQDRCIYLRNFSQNVRWETVRGETCR